MVDRMKFAVTPAQIGAARAKLAEAGFSLAGDTGVLQKDGYRIGYARGAGKAHSGPARQAEVRADDCSEGQDPFGIGE